MITNKPRTMQSIHAGILKRFLNTLMLTIFLSWTASAQQEPNFDWHVAKSKWGIDVSTRLHSTGYKYVRASTTVKGEPKRFLKLLDDTTIGPEWIANCEKVELVDSDGESMRIVHTFFKAPWPVKNRDMVTKSHTSIDEKTGNITITVEDYGETLAPADKYVRMQAVQGKWSLIYITEQQYELVYEGYGEPAGNIPLWLANRLLVSSTFDTFVGIKEQLEH